MASGRAVGGWGLGGGGWGHFRGSAGLPGIPHRMDQLETELSSLLELENPSVVPRQMEMHSAAALGPTLAAGSVHPGLPA